MARSAATGAIIPGMIVRARQRHHRIDQASLLEAEKNRIGTKFRAKPAITQFVVRLAGIFFTVGVSSLRLFLSAPLKNAQSISPLRNFPTQKRIELWQHAFGASFLGRGSRKGLNGFRFSVAIVALAEMRIFRGIPAIVVKRRSP